VIDKIYYNLNLCNAWEKVRADKGAGGVDRESMVKFEENPEESVERLHQKWII